MEKKERKRRRQAIIVDIRCGEHSIKFFNTILVYLPSFSWIPPGFNAEYYKSFPEAHLGTTEKWEF